MKSVRNFNYYMFLFFLFVFTSLILCKSKKNEKQKHHQIINQIAANPVQSIISINNITTWVGDNGFHDLNVGSVGSFGGVWNGSYPNVSLPNNKDAGVIYSEGIIWGGKVSDGQNPLVRVNGNTYASGTVGVTRLFRVRPDYLTADLTRDAADFFKKPINSVTETDIQELRDQYEIDWNEWPAGEGALYKDVDGDGQYTPTIDIPGIPGASQTIFIKYIDADSDSLYGSPPIGLEFSETYWAYNTTDALNNVIFKKVDIVYKGTANSAANSKIDSFYISQWADPDVGDYSNDFAGCDTTLNLGYAYNSNDLDYVYD